MIKKCKVLSRNSINMVVMFGTYEVQMMSDKTKDNFVYVEYSNGHYYLSTKDCFEKEKKVSKRGKDREIIEVIQ